MLHPHWTFAGVTAADAHGLDHSWNVHDRSVYIADDEGRNAVDRDRMSRGMPMDGHRPPRPVATADDGRRGKTGQGGPEHDRGTGDDGCRSNREESKGGVRNGGNKADAYRYDVRRLFIASIAPVAANGIKVTDAARTLIDCGLSLPFRFALPMFDSAARQGVDMGRVAMLCKSLHPDCAPIAMLLRYADAGSENGGESMVRAFIIGNGFVVPELQVEFFDPAYPVRRCRVDYLWRLYDGRMIVLEYDGMAKYENPAMTRGRSAKQILNERDERDRILRAAGVTTVLHCTYEDAFRSNRLFMMLNENGVPKVRDVESYQWR